MFLEHSQHDALKLLREVSELEVSTHTTDTDQSCDVKEMKPDKVLSEISQTKFSHLPYPIYGRVAENMTPLRTRNCSILFVLGTECELINSETVLVKRMDMHFLNIHKDSRTQTKPHKPTRWVCFEG